MKRIRCLQIDTFTDRPFAGNPACVCLLDREHDARWMQAVAAEMNLSETAFVRRLGDRYSLRWFTPAVEVDLCGHATLAAAHGLWQLGEADAGAAIEFETRSGVLSASPRDPFIELDFPATPATQAEAPAGLVEALGVRPVFVGRTRFDYLVVVESAAEVRALRPDFGSLSTLAVRGTIVTAGADDPQFDFVSRFFAPAAGVNEDPVTGSAHCCLAPFWQSRIGKDAMVGQQVSARGGVVHVRVAGDRVKLAGQAVTVWSGELTDTAGHDA